MKIYSLEEEYGFRIIFDKNGELILKEKEEIYFNHIIVSKIYAIKKRNDEILWSKGNLYITNQRITFISNKKPIRDCFEITFKEIKGIENLKDSLRIFLFEDAFVVEIEFPYRLIETKKLKIEREEKINKISNLIFKRSNAKTMSYKEFEREYKEIKEIKKEKLFKNENSNISKNKIQRIELEKKYERWSLAYAFLIFSIILYLFLVMPAETITETLNLNRYIFLLLARFWSILTLITFIISIFAFFMRRHLDKQIEKLRKEE